MHMFSASVYALCQSNSCCPSPFLIHLQMTLFDPVGMHRPSIATIYFRRSKATLLVYDITSQESFDGLVKWENEANEKTGTRVLQDHITVLIGNKIDLEDERSVSRQRAIQFADNHAIPKEFIFEVSAKTGQGVMEMFNYIAKAVNSIPNKPIVQPSGPPPCSKCWTSLHIAVNIIINLSCLFFWRTDMFLIPLKSGINYTVPILNNIMCSYIVFVNYVSPCAVQMYSECFMCKQLTESDISLCESWFQTRPIFHVPCLGGCKG